MSSVERGAQNGEDAPLFVDVNSVDSYIRIRDIYFQRQYRTNHPDGNFVRNSYGTAIGWVPSMNEVASCCDDVTPSTPENPYTLNRHCRTIHHLATRYGLNERLLRRYIRDHRRNGGMTDASVISSVSSPSESDFITIDRVISDEEERTTRAEFSDVFPGSIRTILRGFGYITHMEQHITTVTGETRRVIEGVLIGPIVNTRSSFPPTFQTCPAWSNSSIDIQAILTNQSSEFFIIGNNQCLYNWNNTSRQWLHIGNIVEFQVNRDTTYNRFTLRIADPPTQSFDYERLRDTFLSQLRRDFITTNTTNTTSTTQTEPSSTEIRNKSQLYVQLLKDIMKYNDHVRAKVVHRVIEAYKDILSEQERNDIEARYEALKVRWR